jgi:hypothetical protein
MQVNDEAGSRKEAAKTAELAERQRERGRRSYLV